ncbi:DUF2254 domain-containing protein [Marivivens sp. LCG002]|uniref:DUF2254 domain-containing protein n=1 Tax=Marivivens sp. LCG002 TaxID=3051171 RepID=UPI0025537D89|nr:DUF2254 domain-containing protein [Marivivens sp. LCG002]WIV52030.1 DUF2254 domain-containing protein [Marivivens sp. LCG002]
MFTTFIERFKRLTRNLFIRVLLIGLLSILATLVAKVAGAFIPATLAQKIGASSVDTLLNILANSMLAVTTFSLSVMVSVHRSVSSQWSPRAHRMQLRDNRTQSVLATFVGAYIYALLSIILRETGFYGERELVVLYVVTLAVFGLIVWMILTWIFHLQTFGSLGNTADRIEDLARTALEARVKDPALGAHPLTPDVQIPHHARPLMAPKSGFVKSVFPHGLDQAMSDGEAVYITISVGDYVQRGEPVGFTTAVEERAIKVWSYIDISSERDADQDPVFGLLMLAEIASKALSPGINDGGTAIDIMGRISAILMDLEITETKPAPCTKVWMPEVDVAALLSEPFELIARDGADKVEVQVFLQNRLRSLAAHPHPAIRDTAKKIAQSAMERSEQVIDFPQDIDAIKRAAAWIEVATVTG